MKINRTQICFSWVTLTLWCFLYCFLYFSFIIMIIMVFIMIAITGPLFFISTFSRNHVLKTVPNPLCRGSFLWSDVQVPNRQTLWPPVLFSLSDYRRSHTHRLVTLGPVDLLPRHHNKSVATSMIWSQWVSTFLMLQPLNPVPHAGVTPNITLFVATSWLWFCYWYES